MQLKAYMTNSRFLTFLLCVCTISALALPSAHAGPPRVRTTPFFDRTKNYYFGVKPIENAQQRVHRLTLKKQLEGNTMSPQDSLRLDQKIVRAETRLARLEAKQAARLAKAKQRTAARIVKRDAYAAKIAQRSTKRLLVEQWIARKVIGFLARPGIAGPLGVLGLLQLGKPELGDTMTLMAQASTVLMAAYLALETFFDDNYTPNQFALHKTIAPYHAAELLKRGIVTPENQFAVDVHENNVQQELKGLRLSSWDPMPTSLTP